ncbi:uncharacterized protein LOC126682067 [Mercurialis annua]|uniref:uncharacterized protein LOC126682067 n=1 Tax=Mercurialis annua TaxID=3986 RepID=UPI00215E1199|nr:uncharacterized protein LOC126682067 [Mercurialis annua]
MNEMIRTKLMKRIQRKRDATPEEVARLITGPRENLSQMKTSSRSLHEYAADNEVIKKTKSLHELLCLNPQAAGPSRQKTSKSQAARKAPAKRYKTSVPTPSRAANSAQGPTNSAQGPTNSVANPAPIPAPAPPRSLLKLKAPIPPKATSSSNVSSKKKRVWIPPGFGDKTN